MNTTRERNEQGEDQQLKAIFDGVTPRVRAPDEDREQVFAAVHDEWLQLTAHRRDRRRLWTGLLAASVVAAVALMLWWPVVPPVGQVVATVDRVQGTVLVGRDGSKDWQELRTTGEPIAADARLKVLEGAISLRLTSGAALRLGMQSSVRFSGQAAMQLDAGRLYFDSYNGGDNASVIVGTPFGTVHNVGTQFQVRVNDGTLDVSVRSGAAAVNPIRAEQQIARAGERLTIDSSSDVVREQTPVIGTQWAWAEALAPAFELGGSSVSELLHWYARETGYQVNFATEDARQRAHGTTLAGGPVRGATREQLVNVLATTVFEVTMTESTMLVVMTD